MSKSNNRALKRRAASQRLVSTQYEYSGPLPAPQLIERYELICPGAADRILAQWESQSSHRQGLENRALDANITSMRSGQAYGFAVAMSLIAIGGWLIHEGHSVQGFSLIAADAATLAAIFVMGKRRQKAELEAKRSPNMETGRTVHME